MSVSRPVLGLITAIRDGIAVEENQASVVRQSALSVSGRAGVSAEMPGTVRRRMWIAKKGGRILLRDSLAAIRHCDTRRPKLDDRPDEAQANRKNGDHHPPKATLFAGETQIFVAKIVGGIDRTVTWSVDEEDGGTITMGRLYRAESSGRLSRHCNQHRQSAEKSVGYRYGACAYCDPPAALLRP